MYLSNKIILVDLKKKGQNPSKFASHLCIKEETCNKSLQETERLEGKLVGVCGFNYCLQKKKKSHKTEKKKVTCGKKTTLTKYSMKKNAL